MVFSFRSHSHRSQRFALRELPCWARARDWRPLLQALAWPGAVASEKGGKREEGDDEDDESFVQLGKYKGPPKQVVLCGRGRHASHALAPGVGLNVFGEQSWQSGLGRTSLLSMPHS